MIKCPLCKAEIDEKASVCPNCHKNLAVAKHPGCAVAILGLGLASCGLWLIWIPFLGIPMILVGLAIVILGFLTGIAGLINKELKND